MSDRTADEIINTVLKKAESEAHSLDNSHEKMARALDRIMNFDFKEKTVDDSVNLEKYKEGVNQCLSDIKNLIVYELKEDQ